MLRSKATEVTDIPQSLKQKPDHCFLMAPLSCHVLLVNSSECGKHQKKQNVSPFCLVLKSKQETEWHSQMLGSFACLFVLNAINSLLLTARTAVSNLKKKRKVK